MDPNSANKEQYLGLKVMRLLKPSLFSSLPFYKGNENNSSILENVLLGEAFHCKENNDISLDTNFSLSDLLILPQSFGNIFIGEVFSSYICIHNHTLVNVTQLSVKVELQTKAQKFPIPIQSSLGEYVDEFQYDQTYDAIIHHAVKELGVHVLICNVNYTTEKDEKMGFKKFFKFIVSKPFEIQPRFPTFEKANTILFEAQIENVTNNILYMEKVCLDPNEGLHVEDLNVFDKKYENDIQSIFGRLNYMKPKEVKQYLFRIRSLDSTKVLEKPLNIGKLDIVWRNPFSDIGRLQTNQLQQPIEAIATSIKKDLDVKVITDPDLCYLEKPLALDVQIKNTSERVLELELKLENNEKRGYFWTGEVVVPLSKLEVNETKTFTIHLVPFKCGLLDLSGITITDLFLKRVHDFTNLLKFFVV